MRNPTTWIAVGIMALALALRLIGIDWGLPLVYEEAYPLKKSWDMWGWDTGSFTLDPKFFNYPTLYMYVQLLGEAILYGLLRVTGSIQSSLDFQLQYFLDPTPFYLMGRGITTAFAIATVGVTFAIGKRVAGLGAAVVASTWVALNGFHITKSQVVEVDVPLTLFVLLTGWYSLQLARDPRLRNYLLAGLFAGLATSTKYSGGLLPLTIVLAHFVALYAAGAWRRETPVPAPRPRAKRDRPKPRKAAGESPDKPKTTPATMPTAPALSLWRNLVLAGLVCVAALLLTSPYLVLDWQAFQIGFNYERTHMREGHFGLDQTPALVWYARVVTGQILGWPLAILSAAGLVWLVAVKRRAWAAILAMFPLVYVLILSSWSMKAARFILPVLPIACLMAAVLLMALADRLRRRSQALGAIVAAILAVGVAVPGLAEYRTVLQRARGDTRTVSRQWIMDNVDPGAFLVSEAYGPEPLHAIHLIDMNPDLRKALDERPEKIPVYGYLQIPMLQVRPEMVSAFYDLDQYVTADYLMTASTVRQRYEREPSRFPRMIQFYQRLEREWPLVQSFSGSDGVGLDIHIYRNPAQTEVLVKRGKIRAPASMPRYADPGTGLVAPHLQRIGANLETFGYYTAAAEAYELALTYPPVSAEVEQSCILRAMQARMRAGQPDRARVLLDAALTKAQSTEQRVMLENVRKTYFEAQAQEAGGAAPASSDSLPRR